MPKKEETRNKKKQKPEVNESEKTDVQEKDRPPANVHITINPINNMFVVIPLENWSDIFSAISSIEAMKKPSILCSPRDPHINPHPDNLQQDTDSIEDDVDSVMNEISRKQAKKQKKTKEKIVKSQSKSASMKKNKKKEKNGTECSKKRKK